MLSKIKLIFFSVIVLLLNSCSHTYYAPDEANVLKLTEQHDLKISVSGNSTKRSYTLKHSNFQLGYSPIKHLGLFASHFRMRGNDSSIPTSTIFSPTPIPSTTTTMEGSGRLSNAAIGGYYFFENNGFLNNLIKDDFKESVPSGILLDAYFGYSKGMVENIYDQGGISNFDFEKRYIQAGVHWQSKVIGLSYVLKFGRLNYYNGLIEGRIDDASILDVKNIIDNQEFPFRETSFKFYMGVRHARFYVNVATVVTDFDNLLRHQSNLASFGVVVELDEFVKSMKSKK